MSDIEIARDDREGAFRSVRLTTSADGLRLHSHDISRIAEQVFGRDGEYEFWLDIKAADLPRLAAALLAEKYAGNLQATDELRAFCDRQQIPASWSSWP
jgi:hypothetical protein